MLETAIVLAILIILYMLYLAYYRRKVTKNIRNIIANGATLIDVRTMTEFKRGHLKNTINIPISNLKNDTILVEKNDTIITYCSHGIRSYNAVTILNKKGYEKVYNGGAMKRLKKFMI